MRVLMIGRSYPESKTGMMGIFEFEQATALKRAGQRWCISSAIPDQLKALKIWIHQPYKKQCSGLWLSSAH